MAHSSVNVEKDNITSAQETLHTEKKQQNLSPSHIEYLLSRHGTLELNPVPSAHHADPYNWPAWKVCLSIVFLTSPSKTK